MSVRGPATVRPMTKHRNFSPWAYWQLHLAAVAASAPDGGTRQARSRADLRALLGSEPRRVPLEYEVTDSVSFATYRRDRVVFDVEAAMSVPAFLLVPHALAEAGTPGSAVLAIHGHGPGKAQVCDPDDEHQAYAHALATRGHVVLAPDLRCFGERQDPQWEPEHSKYDCDWNLVCAVMAGTNPIAQNLWDLQRCLDVLVAHELVDAQRIGACGLSYGATMALLLAAMDDRVRAVVVSGFLSSWEAAHRVPWNMCGSQVMWDQLGAFEHLDLGALVAPREMLVESGRADPIFPLDAARTTMGTLHDIYAELGASDALHHDEFDGGHVWNGVRAYPFFDRTLTALC